MDQAILALRADPGKAAIVHDSYLGEDVLSSALRFEASGEFKAALNELGGVKGLNVLDLGAGNGIASFALARAGASRVVALEPDASGLVGRGAMQALQRDASFEISEGLGEKIPFADATFDLVYARQVLHHIARLPEALREFARVLKPGGRLLALREHVCNNEGEMKVFFEAHPVHQLAGNEGAHALSAYLGSIQGAGLRLDSSWGPLDSVLNAYPQAHDELELMQLPLRALKRLGPLAGLAAALPGALSLIAVLQKRRAMAVPGRIYSFLATKI